MYKSQVLDKTMIKEKQVNSICKNVFLQYQHYKTYFLVLKRDTKTAVHALLDHGNVMYGANKIVLDKSCMNACENMTEYPLLGKSFMGFQYKH